MKEELKKLGLSKNEANVYISLLSNKLVKASIIIKDTGLHRMLVYDALKTLQDKGLVSVIFKKNVKLFQAINLEYFINHSKKLLELAESITPKLIELNKKNEDLVSVRTYMGVNGFFESLEILIDSTKDKNKVISIFGGATASNFYEVLGTNYKKYIDLLEKYKIKKRLLTSDYIKPGFKQFQDEKNNEIRTLEKGLTSPTYTRITEDIVSIEIYQPQIVIIHIKNETIAKSHLEEFELLWKVAKK